MDMKSKLVVLAATAAFALSACATTGHANDDFSSRVKDQMGNDAKVEMTGPAVSCGGNQKSHGGAESFKATKADGQVRTGVACYQDGTIKISFDPK